MARNRDDFTEKTKRILGYRAGSRCSNPQCRVPTHGPSNEGPDKINNIGNAAHITAAASGPGGRRYNKALKPYERRSVTNGIWLCASCATLIDNDEKTYTVALLNEWKKKAEDQAKREQGKKLPGEHDGVNTLTAALTGQSGRFLPDLMPNASKASSNYLESLDPRFIIETSFYKGITHHTIHPKEPVDVKFKIKSDFSKEFVSKYNALIERGENLVIDSSAVELRGSPLLEKLTEDINGTFEFHSFLKKDAVIRTWLVSPDEKTKLNFYDLHGRAVAGTKSMTATSRALGGLLSMSISFSVDNFLNPIGGEFSFSLNCKGWDKKPLDCLPYFDGIYKLYRKIHEGWILNFSLEIEGMHLLSAHSNDIAEGQPFLYEFERLDFIYDVREIARNRGHTMYYDPLFEYDFVLYSRVKEIYKVLSKGSFCASVKGINLRSLSCKLTVFEDRSNIEYLRGGNLIAFWFDQTENEPIELFGQKINLPPFSYGLTKVMPKILVNNPDTIISGDKVKVEFIPVDDCQYTIEKLSDVRRIIHGSGTG